MAKKNGRPKIEIDWKVVDKLLKLLCTGDEIAGFLEVSYDTLVRRCRIDKKKSFADFSKQKRGGGKITLRKKQWALADTSPAMAIFLGKQHLGQSDKISTELTGKNGRPLIPKETIITVTYCKSKK